ncbi:DNA cytosine methyltransferase [Butyrivibrio sp. WCD2001]|uniref:DNA cytosine methyltransferase n=1 Tax=Butyrivibrio sp. WCD2001 TaxID=1280681 RepID=UPI0004094645|nr:DNA (cytosine-5-)-methyltransferase [Butyrivibrio sp. WCD2001]
MKKKTIAGFFAGIGGIEEGFHREGARTVFLCEKDERAKAVLKKHYPRIKIADDITEVESIPKVDIVTAGFPCQDLSQAGLKKGIEGSQSSLVQHLFRILGNVEEEKRPEWIVIENVSYMVSLDSGNAIKYITSELEKLGYVWGYRIVDARAFGVPQRRQRLLLVASKNNDVRNVLFADDIKEPPVNDSIGDIDPNRLYGFYWTEGKRGLGWTVDGVPTLKIGSKIGIPSPPAIWNPATNFFGTPDIRDAEKLQGFNTDWTLPAMKLKKAKRGDRWHLVGNAVCVNMSQWLAHRIFNPGQFDTKLSKEIHRKKWPKAAYGYEGHVFEVNVGMWPINMNTPPLKDYLQYPLKPLTKKGMRGFYTRAVESTLINYPESFIKSMEVFLENMEGD